MCTCGQEIGLKHLENQHVRTKIRRELQRIRDRGCLEFVVRGWYVKTFSCFYINLERTRADGGEKGDVKCSYSAFFEYFLEQGFSNFFAKRGV